MTNKEILALNTIADRIDSLASLENCCLDNKAKEEFKPYMMWFECCSSYIREVLDLSTEKGIFKSEKLNEIIRLCQ